MLKYDTKVLITNLPFKNKITKEGRCVISLNSTFETVRMPLSLAILAAELEKFSSQIKIIDANAEDISEEKFIKTVKDQNPDLIFINCSTPTIQQDISTARMIKNSTNHIIFFGQQAMALPINVLKEANGSIDIAVTGDIEITARKILQAYVNKKDMSNIEGTVSSYNNIIKKNKNGPPSSVTNLPRPSRHLLNNKLYKLPSGDIFTSVLVSRGCPYNCSFCNAPFYHGLKIRTRTPDQVVQEIEDTMLKYGIQWFLLASDLFTANKKWVRSFCKLMLTKKIKVKWMCNSRVDTVDYDLLKIMKEAGCWMITFGIESGDQNILDSIGKHIKLNQIEEIINHCNQLKIISHGSFIFGLPGETKESIQNTITFAKSIPLDLAFFYLATPYPGTELFNLTKYKITKKDWKHFNFNEYIIDSELSEEDILKFQKQATKEFYWRPSYIIRQIQRSLHNPLLTIKHGTFMIKKLLSHG